MGRGAFCPMLSMFHEAAVEAGRLAAFSCTHTLPVRYHIQLSSAGPAHAKERMSVPPCMPHNKPNACGRTRLQLPGAPNTHTHRPGPVRPSTQHTQTQFQEFADKRRTAMGRLADLPLTLPDPAALRFSQGLLVAGTSAVLPSSSMVTQAALQQDAALRQELSAATQVSQGLDRPSFAARCCCCHTAGAVCPVYGQSKDTGRLPVLVREEAAHAVHIAGLLGL